MNPVRANCGKIFGQEICQRASLLRARTCIPTRLFSHYVLPHRQLHSSPNHQMRYNPYVDYFDKDFYRCYFPPNCQKVGQELGLYSSEEIAKEKDLCRANINFSLKHGGNITKVFVTRILDEIHDAQIRCDLYPNSYKLLVDVSIVHLKKGEYPATPRGWHTDFPRLSELGEPNYLSYSRFLKSFIVNFSSHPEGVSNTEYLGEAVTLDVPYQRGVRTSLNEQLQKKPTLQIKKLRDGEILRMDPLSLHRAAAAHNEGMRGFIRVAVIETSPFALGSKS